MQDVQRSISYYQDTHPDARITRLIGIGSTFKILGLRKLNALIAECLRHPFEGTGKPEPLKGDLAASGRAASIASTL